MSGNPKGQIEDAFVLLAKDFYDIQPFMYDEIKKWWLWNEEEKRWYDVEETTVINAIYKEFQFRLFTITKNNIKTQLVNGLKMVGRMNEAKPFDKNWVQFKERIYDIKTKKWFEASPEYFNVNVIPWNLGEENNTPKMDELITSWVSAKYLKTAYEIIAYSMIQDYPISRIFLFNGSGSNGKSCFLEMIQKFIGLNNTATTELEGIMERFGTTALYKKLVCLMGETNFNRMNKTSLLKKLSGGDAIDFEFKGKDRFTGHNYATLIIATNTIPTTSDKTDGFYRRWMIIDFPNKFTEKRDVLSEIPEQEYNNLATKCLDIIYSLLKSRSFSEEGTVEERKKRYENKSNPVAMFIKEKCVIDVNGDIPIFKMYDAITPYLSSRGYRKITKIELGQIMKEEGFEIDSLNYKQPDGDYKKWRCYLGLRFKDIINDYSTVSTDSTTNSTSLSIGKTSGKSCTISTNDTKKENILLLCRTEQDQETLVTLFGEDLIADMLTGGELSVVKPGVLKVLK